MRCLIVQRSCDESHDWRQRGENSSHSPRNGRSLIVRAVLALLSVLLGLVLPAFAPQLRAGEFDDFTRPLLVASCSKCHGEKVAKGQINFDQVTSDEKLRARPELIQRMIEALDANDMPPESEPALAPEARTRLIQSLKTALREATRSERGRRLPLHRLNRFQYNYAVRDLFRLSLDVYELPEKLVTRRDRYFADGASRVPDTVHVVSQALQPAPGLKDVQAFPKDLRAEHGYDNQANQLTLSPLLLDAFLRLSVSIVESPDFEAKHVGIWGEFFEAPAAGVDAKEEAKRRLRPFLRRAFRGPIDDETWQRYSAYVAAKLDQGTPFTEVMKKGAAAVLCSPRFLYRAEAADGPERQFALASRLSFFLWSSGPDDALLDLAERGELARPETLRATVDRMMADPKIERFLDSFPTQWLQLENVFAATPDPRKSRYYRVDANYPAGLQMVVEPLLLFDAVFVENRPIAELIVPSFSYRSEFLHAWYESPLEPTPVDVAAVTAENERLAERRKTLAEAAGAAQREIDALANPVRAKLLEANRKRNGDRPTVDLKPLAAWEFNGDLNDSIGELHLKPHGEIKFQEGAVVLERAYLLSAPLPTDLKTKTLEVSCRLTNLDQPGGGLMGIQGPGDFFDTIVIGERKPRHWISGSNGFQRTDDFGESTPEDQVDQWIHLTMVYSEDGTTTLYRNGTPYGKPFRIGLATFPKGQSSVIFGLRHLPAIGNRFLAAHIERARLYDRALTADEVAAAASGAGLYVSEKELQESLGAAERERYVAARGALARANAELAATPAARDPEKLKGENQRRFEDELRGKLRSSEFRRVAVTDPRYGGVITNAAVLTMTSGPQRTQPIARGSWIIGAIFNDPPPPPPNDVPPLREDDDQHLTIREKFAQHRENPSCAGCHARIDPLGFALENFDLTGRWREKYENGKPVDASGVLLRKYEFDGPVSFKGALLRDKQRFARAFASHLLRFALARELQPRDSVALDAIVRDAESDEFRLKSLIRAVALGESFLPEE